MPDLVGRASTRAELGAPNFCERGSSGVSPHLVAFTLIEVMVVMVLLSLIVLALMTVFNSTQTAFRASMTQADVLEGGRAVMDLITEDVKGMSPSFDYSNSPANPLGAVNFYASTNPGYVPLWQSLIGSSSNRTNVLEKFFILSRNNQTWSGVGYVVDTSSTNPINPLYRFSPTDLPTRPTAFQLFTNFLANSILPISENNTNMSHLIDGVMDLRVRAYDVNGVWMTNGYAFGQSNSLKNVLFQPSTLGEVGFYMYSNSLPASVEIEMATLEDRALQRAESLPNNLPAAPPIDRRTLYLQGQAGKVHVFRQRVSIPNVDPSAYQ